MASDADLARDLAQVVSEAIFDVARLVQALRHQRFAQEHFTSFRIFSAL
jgi:hypothetical protein